jgi:hypothetical protein
MVDGLPEKKFRIPNRSAAKGVNTRVFALDIADDEAVELKNIDTSTPGQRVKRSGFSIAATGLTAGPVLALSEFTPKSDTADAAAVLLAVAPGGSAGDNAQLWKWDGTGTQFTHVGALTGYTGPASQRIDIIPAYDVTLANGHFAWISSDQSGVDRWYYDGTSLAQAAIGSTDEPKGPLLSYAFSRAWGTSVGIKRNHLYFSSYGSCISTAWWEPEVDHYVIMGGASKDKIVASVPFRQDEMIVFFSDRIEQILVRGSLPDSYFSGYDAFNSWQRKVTHTTIGCGSYRSITNTGEDIYFADQYGNIRSLARTIQDAGQGARSLPASEPIKSWIDRVNPAVVGSIVAESYDRWVLVALPIDSATIPTHVFALDTVRTAGFQRPVWDGPWTDLDVREMTVAALDGATDNDDRRPTLYFAQNATAAGIVGKLFRTNEDTGSAIAYDEITKRHSVDTLELDKTFTRLNIFAVGSGTVTLQVQGNAEARGWEHIDYVDLTGDVPALPQTLPFILGGTGVVKSQISLEDFERVKDLQFRFTATTSGEVKFLGYTVLGYHDSYEWDLGED